MKPVTVFAVLSAAGLLASGCSSVSDIMGSGDPPPVTAQANQDLSMPPDLQLRAPGTAPPPSVSAPATQVASAPAPITSAPAQGTAAPAPEGDIYERNGIAKFNPDGTPKTDAELQAELKRVYLAKKQQTNPNYGTVFNIGNIFKDE